MGGELPRIEANRCCIATTVAHIRTLNSLFRDFMTVPILSLGVSFSKFSHGTTTPRAYRVQREF